MNLKTWKREKDLEKFTFQQPKSQCFQAKAINNNVMSGSLLLRKKMKKIENLQLKVHKSLIFGKLLKHGKERRT
jgi:hypothetical protein